MEAMDTSIGQLVTKDMEAMDTGSCCFLTASQTSLHHHPLSRHKYPPPK